MQNGILATISAAITRAKVQRRYWRQYGRLPNLESPRLFSERIQASKLTDRREYMPQLTDKVLAKEFVAERLGRQWITPTLFAGPKLPAAQQRTWPAPYVIKVNHRSGGNFFIDGRSEPDWKHIEREVGRWLKEPHGKPLGEWAYAPIKPQVLVEPFIGDGTPPPDFKFFTFAGRVRFVQVHTDRFSEHKARFYDPSWTPLPYRMKWPLSDQPMPPPSSLAAMISGVERLTAGIPFVRVDLYEIDGSPRFGEFTFYPDSGLVEMDPELDRLLGDFWPT